MKQNLKIILLLVIILLLSVNSINTQSEKQILSDISNDSRENSLKKLNYQIDKILNNSGLAKSKFGIAVYSIDENDYYYQKNIDLTLTPASLTKLFTTFSALYLMGKDFQIQTSVYYDGEISEGVLNGNVYIYGRGDVLLSVSDLDILAEKISSKGIRKITGNVYGDGSYFDELTNRLEYSNDKDLVEPMPPITALSIEKNTATIIATAGTAVNSQVRVMVIPRTESFIIENKALIRGGNFGSNKIELEEENLYNELTERWGDSPRIKRSTGGRIKIMNSELNDGKQKFTVTGNLGVNQTYSFRYYINNPVIATAGAFKNSLINAGITVNGNVAEKKIDKSERENSLAHFFRPLIDLVYVANKESDNFIAENLFKIIGAYAGEHLNNSTRTRAVQKMIFDSIGVNFKNCVLNDGSGLSRRNLITARSLVSILVKSQYLSFGYPFLNSMSQAGFDGTLRKRMKKTPAENNVFAKTGTLRNASGLSGFTTTQDGELLAFAFVFNGPYVYNYKMVENQLAILLSSFYYE